MTAPAITTATMPMIRPGFMGMLTFRTLSAATAFFGLTGIIGQRGDMEPLATLVLAAVAGIGALFLVSWIMKLLIRMNIDGTVRIEKSVGCRGTVYVSIPAGNAGQGKVQVSVLNRTMEYRAVTAQNASRPASDRCRTCRRTRRRRSVVPDRLTQERGSPMSSFLFAQAGKGDWPLPIDWPYVVLISLAAMVFFIIAIMFITRYRRCPSNQVLVIYGKFTGSATGTRCLHGGARLVLPLVQDHAYMKPGTHPD